MPKDEFDFDDPMELSGVALATEEDTTEAMAECFAEEFMRLGYNHKQVLALFRNPHYLGMNMVLQNRGEAFVRETISAVFARWGRPAAWPGSAAQSDPAAETAPVAAPPGRADLASPPAGQGIPVDAAATDPMGAAVPNLNL